MGNHREISFEEFHFIIEDQGVVEIKENYSEHNINPLLEVL
jgi:hypothetical protein